MKVYKITTANYIGNVTVDKGRVIVAAPQLKWAIGKHFGFVVGVLKGRFGENFSFREFNGQ